MSVSPIDSIQGPGAVSSEAKFNAALNNAKDSKLNDEEFNEALITQAVTIGGQFIIMPKAQEMLNEAQADDDGE